MARQQKSNPLEDVYDLAAMLPWWVSVVLAFVSFVALRSMAGRQVLVSGDPGQLGAVLTVSVLKAMASVGQYVLPIVFLAAAVGSAVGRRKRQALIEDVNANTSADPLHEISWREFEMLVGEAFRLRGFQVVETGGAGADGGVDLVLRKDRETFLVQCKQWKSYKVGVKVVRELFGVMAAKGATGGFVVTSGQFTNEASEFARGRNVKLIEGPALLKLIKEAQAARAGTPEPRAVETPAQVLQPSRVAPTCPKCGAGMVLRKARQGSNAGNEFWGCATYPACRGSRTVP